jgi:endoglucanase
MIQRQFDKLIADANTTESAMSRVMAQAKRVKAQVSTPRPTPSPTTGPLVGVNMAGAEFGGTVPGRMWHDYFYASNADLDYFLDRGVKFIRLPIHWKRVQPTLNGPLSTPDMAEIDRIVARVTERGGTIALDLHNYMRRDGVVIANDTTSAVNKAHLADVWLKLAARYPGERVWLGLMNEPHDMPDAAVVGIHNHIIAALRTAGRTNFILASTNGWSGASAFGDATFANTMGQITDPLGRTGFDIHQYANPSYSGNPNDPAETTAGRRGVDQMAKFTAWARANKRTACLCEFGGTADPAFEEQVKLQIAHARANPDVWIAFAYWAAGAWWGDYPYSIHPSGGVDKPQLQRLAP